MNKEKNTHIYTHMNARNLLVLALCALGRLTAGGQEVLSLRQARAEALEANKSIAKSRLALQKSTSDMKAAKTLFYPRIDLLATDFWSNAKADLGLKGGRLPVYVLNPATGQYVPDVTVGADGSYTMNQYALFPDQSFEMKVKNMLLAGVVLQQPLYMGGKIGTAYGMARTAADMARTGIRLSQAEVILGTDEAYTQAVRARELRTVAEAYRDLLAELRKNVEAACRHGLKTRNDVLKVQVKLNEAELAVQKAGNAWSLACMNLCHVIGRPLDTPLDVDASLPADDGAPLPQGSDVSRRPETALLEGKVELARRQVRLQQGAALPEVGLFASYDYANGGEMAGKKLIDNGAATVGVTFKMPLLTSGENVHKVRAAKAEHQMAQLELSDLTEKMQLELEQARLAASEAQTEVEITRKAVVQAEENLKLSRAQYEAGLEPLSDLLDAQALWQEAKAAEVSARCARFLSHTRCRKAAGTLAAE